MTTTPQKLWANIVLVLFTLVAMVSTAETNKGNLFNEAMQALSIANGASANILAPNDYSKGSEHYQKAEVLFGKKKTTNKVQIELTEATAALKRATRNAELARLTFASTLKARNDAKGVDAQRLAGNAWKKAEEDLLQAASKLEDGNLKRAKSLAEDAEKQYREAELAAIKSSYLDEARTLIKQADKEKVDRYAPKTLLNAKTLLAAAEKELTENRYDIDYPRSLAKQARYEAKHALYLANRVKQLDKGKVTTEEFVLKMEQPLIHIAGALDMVANVEQGVDEVTKGLVANIESLRSEAYELGERKKQLAHLESEIGLLEKRLGIQSERIAEQETQKAKLQKVSDLFAKEEAAVLTEGRNILIRAVGLTFNPGSAHIESRNFILLKKLEEAIAQYPRYSVLIEGHTDSFGGDAANLNLSFARAESVKQYLKANLGNSAALEAIGYGETRPIANNETQEGRARNRRIDLVLRPAL